MLGSQLIISNTTAVDLDGTLTKTDTLHESVLALIRQKPWLSFLLPFWLATGIAYFKSKVASNCKFDVSTLPYNLALIDWLQTQRAGGARVILCTAANGCIARAVSKHLGLFDEVIASDAHTNLSGRQKRKALQERYGEQGYAYVGNSQADIEVWASASHAIVVNAKKAVLVKASKISAVLHVFPSGGAKLSDWVSAIRLHQWLKNFLLFVPLIAAHQLGNITSLTTLTIAFVSFSLCASSVYITNDLLDLESDRIHPRKRYRPFARATLPLVLGAGVAVSFMTAGISISVLVGSDFFIIILLYLFLTAAYSLVLKRLVLVDCLTLATLYTVRIVAGAVAVSVPLSFWLLAFSVFIFLSLALVKRYAELISQIQEGSPAAHGRGYMESDASLLQTLGVSSGYIAALVVALYVRSEADGSLYAEPTAILLVLPILLFWISWVWLKATRGEMHDDPIVFAIKDKVSLFVSLLIAAVVVYAATGVNF